MNKVVLVTGCSSGIGLETAKAMKARGYKVYGFCRNTQDIPGQTVIRCDVSDEDQVIESVGRIMDAEGRIDTVINCAGFGISGAVEFTDLDDAKSQFDTNFFGMVNVNKAVIPHMRERGCGRIINISSVAAPAGIPFQAYYSASKAAIDSYSLALRNEVRPFGIEVGSILPGDIRTGFTKARRKNMMGDDIYNGRIARSVSTMERDEENGIPAEDAGRSVADYATSQRLKPQTTLGVMYKGAVVLLRVLPGRLSNWLVYQLYAR